MIFRYFLFLLSGAVWIGHGTCLAGDGPTMEDVKGLPKRIAFGSCGHQDHEQPILREVAAAAPEIFVYLGDNIYGDTLDMAVLQARYDKLAAS